MVGSRYAAMPTTRYADAEAFEAYLFQCDDNGLYAVSRDPSGENIPRNACAEGWRFRAAFNLGVHESVPAPIAPEPILRGIRAVGYYIWREGLTHGTGQ
jgi:phage/plasmid-associated DNA primase